MEISCFLSRFPTFRIYGTGSYFGADLWQFIDGQYLEDKMTVRVPAEKIESISGYLDDWENVSFEEKRQVMDALITIIRAANEKAEIEWKI